MVKAEVQDVQQLFYSISIKQGLMFLQTIADIQALLFTIRYLMH